MLIPDHRLVKVLLHTASKRIVLTHVDLRSGDAIARCLIVPADGFLVILRGAKPLGIEVAQIDLRGGIALFCREPIPFKRLAVVLLYPDAVVGHPPQRILRVSQTLFRRGTQKLLCFFGGRLAAATFQQQDAQAVLAHGIALLCRFAIPGAGLRIALRCAFAQFMHVAQTELCLVEPLGRSAGEIVERGFRVGVDALPKAVGHAQRVQPAGVVLFGRLLRPCDGIIKALRHTIAAAIV